jgi:hypothetical protein
VAGKKKRKTKRRATAGGPGRDDRATGGDARGWRWFHVSLGALTLLALVPIWGWRFPPLQDYPPRLFMVHVMATFDDPSLDWSNHYTVDLSPGPYKLVYVLIRLFATVSGVEVAAKLFLTLYIILVAVLALRAAAALRSPRPPWPLLLLLPLAYHQMYYLGFFSYFVALPLIFLALIDLAQRVKEPLTFRRCLPQLGYQALFLALHPVAVVIYLGFAAASALLLLPRRDEFRRALLLPSIVGSPFLVWCVVTYSSGLGVGAMSEADTLVMWWPASWSVGFFLLMFTGMEITDGVSLVSTLIWTGLAMGLVAAAIRGSRAERRLRWEHLVLLLSLLAYAVLPFWLFEVYSWLNARCAPVVYIAMVLVLARVRVGRVLATGLVVGCACLLLLNARVHAVGSAEVAQLVPVVSKMRPNARVQPLYFYSGSAALDPFFFSQVHSHDAYYYHVLVGGGTNPKVFPNTMLPVRIRDDVDLPSPPDPRAFEWNPHGAAYDYVLTRGAPDGFSTWLGARAPPVAREGLWALFEVRK